MIALAYLCEAPRGHKDLAKFARQMSRGQRRALGIRRHRKREIPAPSRSSFMRVLKAVNARAVEAAILAFQKQVRGPAPQGELTVKGNQKGLRRTLRTRFAAATPAAFSPSTHDANVCLDRRDESRPTGTSADSHPVGNP